MVEEHTARTVFRDAVWGILVAVVSGYGFVLFVALAIARTAIGVTDVSSLLLMPLPVLVIYSWFVLPVGVLVGVLLPRLVRRRSGLEATVIASIVSVAIATLWMLAAGAFQRQVGDGHFERSGAHDFMVGMAPWLALYSLPWVLGFALTRRTRSTS